MSDLFVENNDYNMDDIFNTETNTASLPEWISVVDNEDNMTGGNQHHRDSIMNLLTDNATEDDIRNAINTFSAGESVANTMNSEQLEQKLADLFNKAQKNSQIRGGARRKSKHYGGAMDEDDDEEDEDYDRGNILWRGYG
jgi:hypothetical protein